MHLVYTTANGVHTLPEFVSIGIIIGAAWGLIRLVIDLGVFGLYRPRRQPFPFDLPIRGGTPTERPPQPPAGP